MTEFRAGAMGQYGHNNQVARQAVFVFLCVIRNSAFQPCHHILYLFAMLGDRQTTEVSVRHVMDRLYGVDFFAGTSASLSLIHFSLLYVLCHTIGDEDNGEQGAWFVLSALGLYSITPGITYPHFPREFLIFNQGTPDYVLGSPIFKHVVIDRSGTGKEESLLHVVALGTEEKAVRVKEVFFAGQKIPGPTVSDLQLAQGGLLQFVMEGEKNTGPIR